MNRIVRMVGLALVVSVILVTGVTGAAFAANPEKDSGNMGQVCPYCDNVSGECEPNFYNWDHDYTGPGPHGTADSGDYGACALNAYSYAEPGPHGAQNAVTPE